MEGSSGRRGGDVGLVSAEVFRLTGIRKSEWENLAHPSTSTNKKPSNTQMSDRTGTVGVVPHW